MNNPVMNNYQTHRLPLLSHTHDEVLQVEVMLLLQIGIKTPLWNCLRSRVVRDCAYTSTPNIFIGWLEQVLALKSCAYILILQLTQGITYHGLQ